MDIIQFNGGNKTFDFSDFMSAKSLLCAKTELKMVILDTFQEIVEDFVNTRNLSHLSFEQDMERLSYFINEVNIEEENEEPILQFYAKENDITYNLLLFVVLEEEDCHFDLSMVQVKDGKAYEMIGDEELYEIPPYSYLKGDLDNPVDLDELGKDIAYQSFLDVYGIQNNLREQFDKIYQENRKLFDLHERFFPDLLLDWYQPATSEEVIPCLIPNPNAAFGFMVTCQKNNLILHNTIGTKQGTSPFYLSKSMEEKFISIGKEKDIDKFSDIIDWLLTFSEEDFSWVIPLSFHSIAVFNPDEIDWDFYCWDEDEEEEPELTKKECDVFEKFIESITE